MAKYRLDLSPEAIFRLQELSKHVNFLGTANDIRAHMERFQRSVVESKLLIKLEDFGSVLSEIASQTHVYNSYSEIFINSSLSYEMAMQALSKELLHVASRATLPLESLQDLINKLAPKQEEKKANTPTFDLNAIIEPVEKTQTGLLVRTVSTLWFDVAKMVVENWDNVKIIPPEKWEEIIAIAFKKEGYDEVILTPRSGDFGRDVIAIKRGVGCVKIVGSVKAYSPGRLVKHDDVRALLGVISGEQDTSKGMLITTSDFAPRIRSDPFISPFLPTRLELLSGNETRNWLRRLLGLDNP